MAALRAVVAHVDQSPSPQGTPPKTTRLSLYDRSQPAGGGPRPSSAWNVVSGTRAVLDCLPSTSHHSSDAGDGMPPQAAPETAPNRHRGPPRAVGSAPGAVASAKDGRSKEGAGAVASAVVSDAKLEAQVDALRRQMKAAAEREDFDSAKRLQLALAPLRQRLEGAATAGLHGAHTHEDGADRHVARMAAPHEQARAPTTMRACAVLWKCIGCGPIES